MTTRKVHADGLDFAWRTLHGLWFTAAGEPEPTQVMVTNALTNIKEAAKYLRAEQAAIELLIDSND